MTIQKLINGIASFYIAKFSFENIIAMNTFIDLQKSWEETVSIINSGKKAKGRKAFSFFILKLQDIIPTVSGTNKRLLVSLLSFCFMLRRAANKERNYQTWISKEINTFINTGEFKKSRLLHDRKVVIIMFPKKNTGIKVKKNIK